MKITLIGLGVSRDDLTQGARRALENCDKVIVRTERCAGFDNLKDFAPTTLDCVYEKSRNFDTLNKKLAAFVADAAKDGSVCYCVDGSVSEDESCKIILKKLKGCEIFDSVSKSAYACNLTGITCGELTRVSAYGVESLKSCRAACVFDIDCEYIAGLVKEKLSDIFGEESDCFFVRGGRVFRIKIYEIDRQKDYDGTCAVTVQEREFLKRERYDYSDLEQIIRLLRKPDGCPWDRVQTSATIRKNMIEEAYELVDAVERDDADGVEEETGDVLMQAAFHSVLSEEKGEFTGTDAITRVIKKLIFRHSHVFGKDGAKDDKDALSVWEKNKKTEKGQETVSDTVLAVPKNMPACMRAQKVGKRSAKSGMDFLSPVSAAEKLGEEIGELLDACVKQDGGAIAEEAGDVLFSAVNVCRLAGVDCEEVLQGATDKFIKRFVEFERLANESGERVEDMDDSRKDYYWMLAKDAVKRS